MGVAGIACIGGVVGTDNEAILTVIPLHCIHRSYGTDDGGILSGELGRGDLHPTTIMVSDDSVVPVHAGNAVGSRCDAPCTYGALALG